jgi:DNA repair protein SbcC/Rad50
MILNAIELENIRSYDKERIEFPRGITLFEGDIGSGKSTVLMGIEFALFGLGSQKPESLLSKKAEVGSVILEFEVDERKYVVKRTLKRRGDSVGQDPKESYLIYDGQTEPLTPSELKQRILQILKFNEPSDPRSESRIFRYAVFTPQEEMKQILRDSSRRLETIRKAFGVEDYRIVTDNAKNLCQKIKEGMTEFAVRFEKLSEYEQILSGTQDNIARLGIDITRLEKEKKMVDEKKSQVAKQLESIKEKILQKEKLQLQQDGTNAQIKSASLMLQTFVSQITSAQKEIVEIDDVIANLEKISNPVAENKEIDKQILLMSDLRDKIRDTKSRINSLDQDIVRLEGELGDFVSLSKSEPDKIRAELDEIRLKIRTKENEKSRLETQRAILEKERADIQKMIADLQNLGAKCPHCEHDLTPEHKRKVEDERRARLQKVDMEKSSVSAKTDEVLGIINTLQKDESQKDQKLRQIEKTAPMRSQWFEKTQLLDIMKKEILLLESQFAVTVEKSFPMMENEDPLSYLRRLRDAQKEYDVAQQKILDLKAQRQKISATVESVKLKADEQKSAIMMLEAQLKAITDQLGQFSDVQKDELSVLKEHTDLEKQLDTMKNMLIRNMQILDNEKAKADDLRKKILDAKLWKNKHTKFSNYYLWLREFFIPTIDKIEKQVLLSIQQSFNDTYRKWYSVLIDDVTKESRIDEQFTPIVEQDGFVQDVEFLSGGEKTSIALAYRLTLNSMMRQESEGLKSNLLILDEPTDGFSKAQLSKVRNLLHELRSQQIILVSHEKELEAYVDNIFQITKDTGVSKIARL